MGLGSGELTYKATLRKLVEEGRLVPYVPKLRYNQQPERYVYLIPHCAERLAALGLAPGEEDAEPHPKEQAEALLTFYCAGGVLVLGHDHMRRGPRPLWMWKTRSLRLGGVYLGRATFVVVDVVYKASFTGKVPDRLRSVTWYATCGTMISALGLLDVASEEGGSHGTE